MTGTKKGARKFTAKMLAKDPDYFRKLQQKAKQPRGGKSSPGSFKKGNEFAAKGGRAGKRGSGKNIKTIGRTLEDHPIEYEEM